MDAGRESFDETAYVRDLVARIARECPRRQAASEDERRAHGIMAGELRRLGFEGTLEGFRWSDSLYANLLLHFGLGTAGSLVSGMSPIAGFALHALAGTSYFLDSTRRAFLLRRLFEFKPSQNLVVTLPASRGPDLRIVVLAHVDAAFTGLLFDPRTKLIQYTSPENLPPRLGFLGRTLAVPTYSQFALAGIDVLRMLLGPLTLPLVPLEALLSVPGLVAFLLNLQVVLKNEIVPGANDDLSGVAALALLARRLAPSRPGNVELVFVVTGAEEASMGGAQALVEAHHRDWDPRSTVALGLDGLAGGRLHYFVEGEVVRIPVPGWLERLLRRVASSDPRFSGVTPFEIPTGGTDVVPFLARGYDGVSLGCVDPSLATPRHYHMPSDTPENLDASEVLFAVDFAERLVRAIIRDRA